VIVDAESTGHIVAQVAAPTTLRNFVPLGPLNEQTLWMTAILEDSQKTGVVVVTTCQEMAVNEALELVEALQTKTKVDTAAVIVNRVPSEIFTKSQEIVFNQLNQDAIKSFISKKTGLSIDLSLQATGLARARRNLATHHIASLRSGLGKVDPIKELLLLPDFSYQSTDLLVSKLSSELEAELS
jgi:anion-transporting  ArsA/GET3 family ATPase